MPRRRILVTATLAAAAAASVLAGCGDDDTGGAPPGGGPLEGRWELSRYAVEGTLTSPGAGITADASFGDGRLGGRAPVNGYSATYRAGEDGALEIGAIAATQMAGPPAAMAAEDAFLAGLEATTSYRSDGRALTLYAADGAETLVFARDEAGILGSWEVTGYNNGRSAVVSPLAGTTLTAVFAGDGTLTGDAGVNRFTTTFRTGATAGLATAITIAPAATTRRAGEPEAMEQEERFLAALDDAETFTIQGATLTLRDGDDAIAVTMTRG